jgi:hypothetical protein
MGLRDGPAALTLTIKPSGRTVDVLASIDGSEAAQPAQGLQANMVWHLLGALTDEARSDESDGGPGIRFTKRATATAAR